MQQRLPLSPPAEQIAGFAMFLHLARVPLDRFPPPDLPPVFLRDAPANVIAAVPLKPAARVVVMNPPFVLFGNSRRQSVMYLPPKTPSRSICAGVSCGWNSGSKLRPVAALKA